MKHKWYRFSRVQIIALGFFIVIGCGTLLLMLPFATKGPENATFTQALFTATSASCVTGLILKDTFTYWTIFGQVVIIVLIQLGGLGFMTMATIFLSFMRKNVGLGKRELMVESINANHVGGIVPLTKMIFKYTVIFELSGALLLSTRFIPDFGIKRGIYYSIFHSISAFCNAGFDLMGIYEPFSSLVPYYNDVIVNITIMLLITIGGLGFLVWADIRQNGLSFKRYCLHTKIVLTTSAILTFGGAILFFILEFNNTGANISMGAKILTSFFNSVTARTAGFNTVNTAQLTNASKMLTSFLMLIGGSSGSTAGGVKTTTIAVIVIFSINSIKHNQHTTVFRRSLNDDCLKKAVSVFTLNAFLALAGAFVISALNDFPLVDIVYETFSAIGTVGLTTGITSQLCMVSWYILIFLMYCGRVGSVGFASALLEKRARPAVTYPVENITIG